MTSQCMSVTSPTKFYCVTQSIMYMWSRDQTLVTLGFPRSYHMVLQGFDQKKHFLCEMVLLQVQ